MFIEDLSSVHIIIKLLFKQEIILNILKVNQTYHSSFTSQIIFNLIIIKLTSNLKENKKSKQMFNIKYFESKIKTKSKLLPSSFLFLFLSDPLVFL